MDPQKVIASGWNMEPAVMIGMQRIADALGRDVEIVGRQKSTYHWQANGMEHTRAIQLLQQKAGSLHSPVVFNGIGYLCVTPPSGPISYPTVRMESFAQSGAADAKSIFIGV